jgi:iron complex outermembrane receptor protein
MQKNIKLSLILVAFLSQASASDVTLKPLSISSTAIKTDELKSTDAVEVYTQEDIEKSHAKDLYEFFNQQTSLITMPSFGNPFAQKLDMHGYGIGDGYQNIVINLNGRKINNIDMVPALLSSISPASVSRIEIIKSSGIVTGGDGANAGVINITTKKNNDKQVTIYAGTYGMMDASAYIGHSDDKLSFALSAEGRKNDGIRYINDSGEKDKSKLTNVNLDISYKVLDSLELKGGVNFSRTDVFYASSLTKAQYEKDPTQKSSNYYPATHQTYDSNLITLGASYYISDELTLNVDVSKEKKKSDYLTYTFKADYDYETAKANIEYDNDTFSMVAGVDAFNGLRLNHATRWSVSNNTKKDNLAGYIMTKLSFDNLSFKAGYRYEKVEYEFKDATRLNKDKHSLNGAELGLNYTLDTQNSIFVNYAHSYQAPDIDRFFNRGVFNNFIEPSKAHNYTLGFNQITKNNKFKISAYYIDLTNEIYYYKDTINSWPNPSLSINTNIDESTKYGLDIYDKFIINDNFNVVLNYNYVKAKIDKEMGRNGENYANKELPGVPKHNVKATFSYLPNSYTTIAFTQTYRSDAYSANDFNNNATQKQEAYNTTDISATYAKDNWEVFAKINNLFNQKNALWVGDDNIYPTNFTTTAIAGLSLKY